MNKPLHEKNINKTKFKNRICQDCTSSIKERRSHALRCLECAETVKLMASKLWRDTNPKKYLVTICRTYLKFIQAHPTEAKIAKQTLIS